jgi:hypothetical protein
MPGKRLPPLSSLSKVKSAARAGTFESGLFTNYNSNNMTKLQASDGTVLGIFSAGTAPLGIAFDGVNIWVANYIAGSYVSKL